MNGDGPDAELRQRAEAALLNMDVPVELPPAIAPLAGLELIHELRVHQIELEMQNEELRRTQASLEESRQRYFDLYDSAPVGYCTVSSTGLILNANLTVNTLLGLPSGGLKLQQIARFIAVDDRDNYYLFSRKVFASQDAASCELRMLKGDGTSFWAKLQANVTAGSLGAPVLRMVVTDISERHAAAQALARARDDAQAASRAKSTFLANMSHEIRTPLNAILGFSHLMLHGATPEQAQRLGKIHTAGQHLLGILNNVLDLSKIDAGGMRPEVISFDLPTLMAEVATLVEEQAQVKGLALTIQSEGLPRRVRGDATRLRQALLNYANNAVKFTSAGSVSISACVVSRDATGSLVRFSVSDTGDGIAPEALSNLFEPFVQADPSVSRRFGGTGLGLAITRRLSELLGGEAGAHSQPGVGSTFWLTARLQEVADANGPEAPAPPGATPLQQLALRHAGRAVLLVDDDEECREIHSALLHEAGLKVDVAKDGEEALRLAAAGDYGVVLMDLQMPGTDGLAATRILRRLPKGPALRVVALAANADALNPQACADAGIDAVLCKPVDRDQMYATVLAQLSVAGA